MPPPLAPPSLTPLCKNAKMTCQLKLTKHASKKLAFRKMADDAGFLRRIGAGSGGGTHAPCGCERAHPAWHRAVASWPRLCSMQTIEVELLRLRRAGATWAVA